MNLDDLKFDSTRADRKWLLGITEFNGEFVVICNDYRNYSTFLENVKFYYIVIFPLKDVQTAYKFKSFFKVGKVLQSNRFCYYFVERVDHHYKRIMKFFNGTKLLSKKRIDYERYRYVLFKVYNKAVDDSNYNDIRKYLKCYVVTESIYLEDLLHAVNQKVLDSIVKKNFYYNFKLVLFYIFTFK